eukprot:1160244-Pelagomonas_calceolata.AAC.12
MPAYAWTCGQQQGPSAQEQAGSPSEDPGLLSFAIANASDECCRPDPVQEPAMPVCAWCSAAHAVMLCWLRV